MHRIDGTGATATNLFTEGDPAASVAATVVTDDWLNGVQEEICNVVEDAGIALQKGQRNQLLQALRLLANTAVATLVELKALAAGSRKHVALQGRSSIGDGGGGFFIWRSGDQSAQVAADPQSGIWVTPDSDPTGASGAWQRQYAGALNVRWFGAVGDGVADDAAAIQAAIDYLPNSSGNVGTDAEGGTITLPPGRYRTTTALLVRDNDREITLRGLGSAGDTILYADHIGYCLDAGGVDTGAGYSKLLRISTLKFQSSNVDRPAGTGAIRIRYLHYFEIDRCWFQGEDFDAIYIEDALDGKIHLNRIDTAAADAQGYQNGIHLARVGTIGAPNQITIEQNYLEDINYAGVRLTKGEKVVVRENLSQSCQTYGVLFDECNSLKITDNYFEANGQASTLDVADIFDLGTSLSANVTIADNHFSSDGSTANFYAMYLNDCRGLNILRNDLRGGSAQQIRVDAACLGVSLRDNQAVFDPTLTISPSAVRCTNNRLRDGTLWGGYRDSDILHRTDRSGDIGSYPATVTPDGTQGRFFDYGTIAGDLAITAPVGLQPGDEFVTQWTQDATGGRAVTLDPAFRRSTPISSTANRRNTFRWWWSGTQAWELSAATDAT